MLQIGSHISSAKGYEAMGKQALKLGANTFAFFTRNPRGGSAKAIVPEDVERFRILWQERGYGKLAVAGGVAANSRIRADLTAACARAGACLFLPELKYCGDNAAMIGCQGYYEFLAGHTAGPELNAYAAMPLEKQI